MDDGADELSYALDSTFLQRGRAYWRQGRVLSVEGAGSLITGRVRGSGGRTYSVSIALDRDTRNRLQVDGECTCPMHYNCKHVAAALLAARAAAPAAQQPDPLLRSWLTELDEARAEPHAYPPQVRDRLLYLLALREYPTGVSALTAAPHKARLLKGGSYGSATPYRAGSGSSARFVRPADQAILRQLAVFAGYDQQLKGDWGAKLLEELLHTGRCHWQSPSHPALSAGPARRGEFHWSADEAGGQRLELTAGAGTVVLPLVPPWYVDTQRGVAGVVDTGLPARLAGTLCNAPRLSPEAADSVAARLADLPVPPPVRLKRERRRDVRPRPCLTLSSRPLAVDHYSGTDVQLYLHLLRHGGDRCWLDQALLQFDYRGRRVAAGQADGPLPVRVGDTLFEVERRGKEEHAAIARLGALGLKPLPLAGAFTLAGEADWLDFALRDLPALRAEGWQITVEPSFRYQLAEPGEWYAELDEQGNEWFTLELGVTVDGERTSLLPLLAAMLQRLPAQARQQLTTLAPEQALLLPLPDGRLLPMPVARLRPLLETLLELYDPQALDADGRLTLSRLQSPVLAELDTAGPLTWAGGEQLRAFGEKLKDFRGIARVEPPAGLNAQLRDYQRQGLDWLQFLQEYGLSGVLADDMGLGKTLQTLAHLLTEKTSGRADRPSLVVAPTSLVTNWRREAERFTPALKVLTLHGPDRAARFDAIAEHDLAITSYPLLLRDQEALSAHDYHLLILDEAQHIKNPRAKAAAAARALAARQRLCLSGTPLENHLGELWSLFHFLMPGLLGERERFTRLFRTPIEKQRDTARQTQLRRRVAPFLLRRTKAAVARELPPKTEQVCSVALAGGQRDLYETVRLAMHERIRAEVARKGWARSQIVILDALLKLRQICCDPRLVKLQSAAKASRSSAKLELLMELLPQLLDEGRRVLLFSQFTSMLALIQAELAKSRIDYVLLTGDTVDRATPVDRFQRGEVPLFLISLKAGGTGLNLTAADTVIHYDPWWNPAVERQATDRAHRIGQDKPVFVYKLICDGTVEERMTELQARKAALSEAVLAEGGVAAGGLQAKDLEVLLAPLG
jgi:superfamily II DNA or RNA helicase